MQAGRWLLLGAVLVAARAPQLDAQAALPLKHAPARTRMIMSLAIFESCAIFGLVSTFLLQDWRLYLAPWALAVIGFLRSWPSDDGSSGAAGS